MAEKKIEINMVKNGTTAVIDVTNGVTIDAENVIKADNESFNGVIHIIDAVMLREERNSRQCV